MQKNRLAREISSVGTIFRISQQSHIQKLMNKKWVFSEDRWNHDFPWFLIEEGEIRYSFPDKDTALTFQKDFYLNDLLLLHIDNITPMTMLDPQEESNWSNKIQKVVQKIAVEA